jgi:hypothetical protein
VFELSGQGKSVDVFNVDGGTLPATAAHVLGAITLCNLAIEARVNHLLDEFVEEGKISADVAEAVRWIRTEQKWFMIPYLYGLPDKLDGDQPPHQAIQQLCGLRNNLMHVKFEALKICRVPIYFLATSIISSKPWKI